MDCYVFLLRDGRMSQKELSDKMNIKESTTVRLVDRMEKDGFIVRFKDSNDRRITYIELTEKGKKG
ncbi:MarR family transcriptional regulator [Caloramator sp. Dgby_cultured_2]|uniref:MarR family transcriptional regulator n=1 Tax=Caloramator sp. Dgby_cultured_2 TaxID=3029174 RepID=UPI00237E70D3|nr:MarR family transcriptional regulator [Caloramator sp. Dgby_cultured_2]WDU82004.1 MarR family transcriptional regulator [Caloramator sp. Dgby_cultured_2]